MNLNFERAQEANAANLFTQHANNPDALRVIAFYYMTKFPQYAEDAVKAVNTFTPAPKEKQVTINTFTPAPKENRVTINVPSSINYNWTVAEYTFPYHQVMVWRDLALKNEKVAAIKQCRADTGLGLKAAKDLVEYLVTILLEP